MHGFEVYRLRILKYYKNATKMCKSLHKWFFICKLKTFVYKKNKQKKIIDHYKF